MALFVDLDADDADDDRCSSRTEPQRGGQQHEAEAAVANDPPVRTAVTEAFQCYPYAPSSLRDHGTTFHAKEHATGKP